MHLLIYGISCLFLHLFNYLFVLLFICLFIHFFIQVAWTCRMTSETSVVIAWWIEFGRVGRNLTTKVLVPKAEEQQWLRKAKMFWSGTLESYISLFRLRLTPWYSFFFNVFMVLYIPVSQENTPGPGTYDVNNYTAAQSCWGAQSEDSLKDFWRKY